MGAGSIMILSRNQDMKTGSSTEAELIGIADALCLIMWNKYFIYIIRPSASVIPTSSTSVELLVLSFYFLEKLVIVPSLIDITAQVWRLQSQCVSYETSTHQRIMLIE